MRKILEAVVVGILTGTITHVGEQYLPESLQFLVATKIIWILPAFLLSFGLPERYKRKDCITIAIINLLTTGSVYYLSEVRFQNNFFYFPEQYSQFICIAIVAGIIIGFVAHLARTATNEFIKYTSMSLTPAIFTGGGIENIINTVNNFEFTPEILTEIIGGFILYILLAGHNKFKIKSLVSYIVLAGACTLIYLYAF